MSAMIAAAANFEWPQLNVRGDKLEALTDSLVQLGFGYGLGAKISPLSLEGPGMYGITESGMKAKEVDCSGFVRWAIYHATAATGEALEIPDGSATQHDWFSSHGFKASSYDSGHLKDGVIRIGFLTPEDGGGVGHVVLLFNGETMESHGGYGPGRRVWNASLYPWMADMYLFVVSLG